MAQDRRRKPVPAKKAGGRKTTKPTRGAPKPQRRAAEEIPAYPEFELDNQAVESALKTGEHAGLLEDYFGPESYRDLRQRAREAAVENVVAGPRVLILPNFLGSRLGLRRQGSPFSDLWWMNPAEIAAGRLSRLALPARSRAETLGVLLPAYLRLKLRLRKAGYDTDFHAYDWRRSLADSGRELAERLAAERGPVTLVAHGMGGLVARWALAHGATCRRLVMLGTPHRGSFFPVQMLRGVHPLLRRISELDRIHDAEWLARNVFSTFPSLSQMLPPPESGAAMSLHRLSQWPAGDDLRPRPEALAKVLAIWHALAAPADDRLFLIAGVGQSTVTRIERAPDGFLYEISNWGDGFVPLDSALLAGVKTWYVKEAHGTLPNHDQVILAVEQILDRGTTDALPASLPADLQRQVLRRCTEAELRTNPYGVPRDGVLSRRELRHLLVEVVEPPARGGLPPPEPGAFRGGEVLPREDLGQHPGERLTINQTRKHRLDLRLALGSITEADTRAIALGIFRDVAPSGPSRALDERLEGTITELFRRRMFSGEVGEIFLMPTGKHPLTADHIAFVGLGPFDRFNEEALRTAAENVLRTFINTRIEEFATVLFGVGSGKSASNVLHPLLDGFLRALIDADRGHFFHRLVICENDPDRFRAMRDEFLRISATTLCENVEIAIDEVALRAPLTSGTPLSPRRDPVYLIVRREGARAVKGRGPGFEIRSSLLTAGAKATVISDTQTVAEKDVQSWIESLSKHKEMDLSEIGAGLSRLLLSDEVRTVLLHHRDRHLVVVHDAFLSKVPWEVLAFQADRNAAPNQLTFPAGPEIWFPAAEEGLSHRYAADNLSIAKWLEQRVRDKTLHVLLVLNPTEDLDGAEAEGESLKQLFGQLQGLQLEMLSHDQATRLRLLKEFGSGKYDVIHYAGHAEFDPVSPERSGILCHGEVLLTGADLAGLGNLPTLVFFNACESARLRRGRSAGPARPRQALHQRITHAVGFAEAFLRGGIANFIGTYWPVGDKEAEAFAHSFYSQILEGHSLGQALQIGREAIRKQVGSKDWANYILYGNPDFVLKDGGLAPKETGAA